MGTDNILRFMRKIAIRNLRRARRDQLDGFRTRVKLEDMRARMRKIG